MLFRNILYKEWKANRKGFLFVVLGAFLVSAFLRQSAARWIYFWLLIFYSGGLSFSIFGREQKTKDFLDAKPITRTNLWLAKVISGLILWCSTILVLVMCLFVISRRYDPSFSILSIILNPHFFFAILLSLAIYSTTLFASTLFFVGEKDTKGSNVKAVILLGTAIGIVWFLIKRFQIRVDIVPFNFRHETLSLFIAYVASVITFSIASYLAFVHREIFWTGILRGKIVYFVLVAVIVIVSTATVSYLISIPVLPEKVKFISSLAISEDGKQVAFSAGRRPSESQMWITDDRGKELTRIGDRFSKLICLTERQSRYDVIWRSNGWLYGPEVWIAEPGNMSVWQIRLSEKDYQYRVYAGMPYLSPDKDRVAYVKKASHWRGGGEKKYLTIASLDGWEVPYEIEGSENSEISPIGWSPNGNRFYFRWVELVGKRGKKQSLWAIDRNAQGLQVITEDFSGHWMNHRDLAKDGEQVSLVSKEHDGYFLWLMNTETGKKMKIDQSLQNFDARAWSGGGERFAYIKLSKGDLKCYLCVLEIADGQVHSILTKAMPMASELKWSPDAKKLLFKTTTNEKAARLGLIDIETNGSPKTLIDRIPSGFQYQWLDNDKVVYARAGKLIAVNICNLTEWQLFPPLTEAE